MTYQNEPSLWIRNLVASYSQVMVPWWRGSIYFIKFSIRHPSSWKIFKKEFVKWAFVAHLQSHGQMGDWFELADAEISYMGIECILRNRINLAV